MVQEIECVFETMTKRKEKKHATIVDLIVAPLIWLVIFVFALVLLFNEVDEAKKLLADPAESIQAQITE
jgi:uncharacterized protein YybS (DUF2232 family)